MKKRIAWVLLSLLGLLALVTTAESDGAKTMSPIKQNPSLAIFAGKSSGVYTKPSEQELRENLSDLQYQVTQNDATERPFKNEYWDEKRDGIYVDIVSGEPLFSSKHKFKSGTGWPSFTRPLKSEHVVEKTDYKLIFPRTEIRSQYGNSHLGHLFKDGPEPTGLRYCINSASLRFVPIEQLKTGGYGEFLAEFEPTKTDR